MGYHVSSESTHISDIYKDSTYKTVENDICKNWYNFPNPVTFKTFKLHATSGVSGIQINPGDQLHLSLRQGGEKFYWHGHNKKLKKLLQEWNIPSWKRIQVPLLYVNNELAMVIGYAINDNFFTNTATGYQIKIDYM